MYTRIKNQKSGIKLLTNASTRAARVSFPAVPSSLASSCASSACQSGNTSAGDSPSSTSLSSLPPPPPTSSCSSVAATPQIKHGFMNASVTMTSSSSSTSSSVDSATVCLDQNGGGNCFRLLGNMNMPIGADDVAIVSASQQNRIPFENQSSNIANQNSSNNKNTKSSQNKYNRSKKLNSASDEANGVEEIGDLNCILYVKSTWEKYASEIGTEKGPSRLVIDENSQCPHLNGFVAFDLEHWWAERALDSIGEHSFSSPSSSKSPNSSSSTSSSNSSNNIISTNIANFNHSTLAKPKSTISPLTGLNSFTIGFS